MLVTWVSDGEEQIEIWGFSDVDSYMKQFRYNRLWLKPVHEVGIEEVSLL